MNKIFALSRWIIIELLQFDYFKSHFILTLYKMSRINTNKMSKLRVIPEEDYFLPSDNMDNKGFSRSLYEKKKRSPERFSDAFKRNRKIRYIQKQMKKLNNIEPHSCDDNVFSFLSTLPQYVKQFSDLTADYDSNLVHLENFFLFIYHMSNGKTLTDYACAAITYIKLYMKTSMSKFLVDMCDFLSISSSEGEIKLSCDDIFEPHSAWEAQTLKDTWTMLRSNPIFPKIGFLITAAMASSVCSIKELDLDFAGIKLIHLEALKCQASALDVIDAIIATFTWIQETGWCCLKERSLSPILYSDQKLRQYTENCNYVISMADALKGGNVEDVAEFERKLDKCIKTTCDMQKVTPSLTIKEVLQRKYASLISIKNDLIAKRKNTAYREAPIGFSIHGESSIGKSDIAELTMKHALTAMGVSDSKEGIITLNECDKYDSTYTSDVLGVFIDDAANSVSTFAEKSPTQKYIQMFNNMAAQAVKAELNEKGCVFINFLVGVITTNVKTLDANLYSNYPVAVLRRFIHINARVKPEYRVQGGTSLNVEHPHLVNSEPGVIIDVWQFDIEEVIADGSHMGKFQIIKYVDENGENIVCKDLNLQQYLKAIIYLSRKHRARQMRQVARNKLMEKINCCSECCMVPQFCCCKVVPHSDSGDFLRNMLWKYVTQKGSYFLFSLMGYFITDCSFLTAINSEVKDIINDFTLLDHLETTCGILPNFVTKTHWFRKLVVQRLLYRNKWIFRAERSRNMTSYLMMFLFFYVCITGSHLATFLLILSGLFWILCDTLISEERTRILEIIDANSSRILMHYGQQLRSNWKRTTAYSIATIVALSTLLHVWNKTRKEPHALNDLSSFDSKPGWFGFTFGSTVSSNVKSTINGSVSSQLVNVVKKNLAWCRFKYPSGVVNKCNVFFLRKSVILVPKHIFYEGGDMRNKVEDLIECEISRNRSPGGKLSFKMRYSMSYSFPDMDMVAVFLPHCPDVLNMEKWFVDNYPIGRSICDFVGMTEDLDFQTSPLSVEFKDVSHRYLTMRGGRYNTNLAQKGACMSVLVSEASPPAIVGFHIGGDTSNAIGICMTPLRKHFALLESWFEGVGTPLSAHSQEIPTHQYDKPIISAREINPKAKYIQSLTDHNEVHVLGSTKLRSSQRSEVEESILSPYVTKYMGCDNKWGPPKLNPNWAAFNTNIEVLSHPSDMFDPMLLEKAKHDWMRPMSELMSNYILWEQSNNKVTFRPLTLRETILGIDGVRFIDAMPMNTGMGFPLFGKKNKVDNDGISLHFEEIREGEKLLDRIPKKHVMDEYNRLIAAYKANYRAYPVTCATLKDEPTLVDSEKVRVFQAAPVALGLVIRQYFLPIARFLCCHPIQSESAVGVNAFGPEWKELMDHAEKFKFDNKMLGWDYSKYDLRMNAQMTRTAWNIFIDLACIGGYPSEAIQIMRAMVVDICHPLIDMNGTLIMTTSMNTSGNNMTVYVNSLVGSLYVRMGFFSIYPDVYDFRKCVALLTYGDDAIGSVNKKYKDFNFISFKKFLANHGMKLTLPSKTDEEIEFLDFEEVDFLKRRSSYIPEINTSIGKLDENSIFKSLHCNLKSRNVTAREVACSCVEGALHEWFAYGRNHYEMRRQQLAQICSELKLPVHALNYTFDDRVEKWKENYLEYQIDVHSLNEKCMNTPCGGRGAYTSHQLYAYLCHASVPSRMHNNTQPDITETHLIGSSNSSADEKKPGSNGRDSKVKKNTKILKNNGGMETSPPISPNCVVEDVTPIKVKTPPTLGTLHHQVRCASGILAAMERNVHVPLNDHLLHQINCAKGILLSMENNIQEIMINNLEIETSQFQDADEELIPHSATDGMATNPISSAQMADDSLISANIGFTDAHPGYHDTRGTETDVLRESLPDDTVSLSEFFKRPIKIQEYEWQVGLPLNQTFDPWQLFFENKRNINRVSNFKMMKCNLCLKIVVNGTGFHYGRMLVSYRPLGIFDAYTLPQTVSFGETILASQRPHFYINPTISQGGQLTLPFFTPFDFIDIPTCQWRQMGDIDLTTIVNLKHANGGTSPVRISVFCWAENLHLTGLTQYNPEFIVPQAKTEYDGIVSKPASIVAKTASALSDIPYIGKMAKATEIGAKSIGYMANLFGYSHPPEKDFPIRHITAIDNIATCDGIDNVFKISVDSQQELSIDPSIAGLDPKDEMTISSISTRETLFMNVPFPVTRPPEQRLFSIVVDPGVTFRTANDFRVPVFMPACAVASQPFKYWRGEMVYRIQFTGSAHHKARIKLVYDPFGPVERAEYNTAYQHIVDLSENPDFYVTVGWGQCTAFRRSLFWIQNANTTWTVGTTAAESPIVDYNSANQFGYGNGVLTCFVLNSLATPNSTINNDTNLLVSVCTSKNIEFAVPIDANIRQMNYQESPLPQNLFGIGIPDYSGNVPVPSGASLLVQNALEVAEISESTQEDIEPQSAVEKDMNNEVPTESNNCIAYLGNKPIMSDVVNKIYIGETVVSFRTLLKRYNLHEVLLNNFTFVTGNTNNLIWVRRNFPMWPEVTLVPRNAITAPLASAITAREYVPARNTLMHFLTACYGGWRGSVRYMADASNNRPDLTLSTQINNSGNFADINTQSNWGTAYTPSHGGLLSNYTPANAGRSIISTSVNPLGKHEIPYMTEYRFCPAKGGNRWTNPDPFQGAWEYEAFWFPGQTTVVNIFKYVAAGEDFNLLFYLGPPPLYAFPSNPSPL